MSIRRFAVLTQQNATFVSQILREQRRPPLHRMEQWADVLRIYGQAREDFLNAAALAHAPQRVVDLLARSGLDFPGLEQLLVCDERNEGTP
ncbi:MAG: hypothetical protein EA401_11745 [Planctomycetota bacterium]|nr:MAG: hypothetical protein EA401_11745 [Planctomycetota bacterium]